MNQQLNKYETFLSEFNNLKACLQRNQSENQGVLSKLQENQAKYEESNLRLTLQDQNLLSLKRHIEHLSQQAKEKDLEMQVLDQKIIEKRTSLEELQRKSLEFEKLTMEFEIFNKEKALKDEDLRNCEKKLEVKEIQLDSLNNEINEKFNEFEELQHNIEDAKRGIIHKSIFGDPYYNQ